MADYKSLENKIRDIVARPWTKDPKQVHHKQQQIQKKIIDEEPDMLNNKALGIPDSVIEAAKSIAKQPTKVEINPDYKPRMDQEEELVGKQHKIDANKNGKIDSDDFKKLRAKTLKEAPPTSSDPDFAAPRFPGSPSYRDEIKFKPEPKKPEQKKPEEKKPVPPLPPKRPSNLNTEGYSGTPKEPRVVFTGSPSHTSKKAEQYKARGYEIEKVKKGPSGIFGDSSEKHTYSMVHKSVKEEKVMKGKSPGAKGIDAAKDDDNERAELLKKNKKIPSRLTGVRKEELKGNQHKIDKNKNGEIDAHDFELLRKEEVEQVDELSSALYKRAMNKAGNKAMWLRSLGQNNPAYKKSYAQAKKFQAAGIEKEKKEKEAAKNSVKEDLRRDPEDTMGTGNRLSRQNPVQRAIEKDAAMKAIAMKDAESNSKQSIQTSPTFASGNIPKTSAIPNIKPEAPSGTRNKLAPSLSMPNMSKVSAKMPSQYTEEVQQVNELNRDGGSIINRYIRKTTDNPKRKAGRDLALKKKWGDKNYGTDEPKVKAVAREEVVFSNEEIAKLENISKKIDEALPLGAIAGALRNFGSSAMKQLPKPQSFPQLPSPDKFQKPMDTSRLAGNSFRNMKDKATSFIDKIKGNGAKNNALLGLQAVHDVSALATGKDPYTQAMQQPKTEVPQADAPDTPESPKAAPTEKKKINAREEAFFSDEEIARLEIIANDIDESRLSVFGKLFGRNPPAPKQLPAPEVPKQLPAPKPTQPPAARTSETPPATRAPETPTPPAARAPETPPAARAPETPTPPKPDKTFGPNDIEILPPAPRAAPAAPKAEPTSPSTTFREPTSPTIRPFDIPKNQLPAIRTRPKVTRPKKNVPTVPRETPKPRTKEPDKTFGPDDMEIIPPAPKNRIPATPDSLKKPGPTIDVPPTPSINLRRPSTKPKTVPPIPGLRNRVPQDPDTLTAPPKTDTDPKTVPPIPGLRNRVPQDPDTLIPPPKIDTPPKTNTPNDIPPTIPPKPPAPPPPPIAPVPPVPMPVPIPPPAMKPQEKCKTCGPNIAYRTYGRVEPRVGAPSPTQVQDSYEPTNDEIREANLAAQIRDAKPSLTGHIEVSVGDKRVKIPHRKAQEFLGSYHSKRTPAEKDAHEKAFRREIGG